MDEELYRLVSTGLLALIVLLLVLAITKLGKLQQGGSAPEGAPSAGPQTDAATDEPDPVTDGPEPDPEPAAEDAPTPEAADASEEGPFERDGRWWYRRDNELLVYDERSEQWVSPDAAEERAPEVHSIEAPSTVASEPVGASDAIKPEPHPLDEARGWDTAPTNPAPIPEPVAAPEPIAQVPEPLAGSEPDAGSGQSTPQEEPAPAELGTHWKCSACGVINGSMATSCRMCFTARP